MRRVLMLALLVALTAYSVLGTEIRELSSEPVVTLDRETYLPILRFTIWLAYVPVPNQFAYDFTWTTFVREGEMTTELEAFWQPAGQYPGVSVFNLTSPDIVIEPGRTYGASLHYVDALNSVTFDRTFEYVAPTTLPTGIYLRGWNGSQAYDVRGLADDVVSQLSDFYVTLTSEYSQQEEDVLLMDLLAEGLDVASEFPLAVIVTPAAGLVVRVGSPAQWGTLSVNQYLHVYYLETEGAIGEFLMQISAFDRDFIGRLFVGSGNEGIEDSKSVFVDEAAWGLLSAAREEHETRPSIP